MFVVHRACLQGTVCLGFSALSTMNAFNGSVCRATAPPGGDMTIAFAWQTTYCLAGYIQVPYVEGTGGSIAEPGFGAVEIPPASFGAAGTTASVAKALSQDSVGPLFADSVVLFDARGYSSSEFLIQITGPQQPVNPVRVTIFTNASLLPSGSPTTIDEWRLLYVAQELQMMDGIVFANGIRYLAPSPERFPVSTGAITALVPPWAFVPASTGTFEAEVMLALTRTATPPGGGDLATAAMSAAAVAAASKPSQQLTGSPCGLKNANDICPESAAFDKDLFDLFGGDQPPMTNARSSPASSNPLMASAASASAAAVAVQSFASCSGAPLLWPVNKTTRISAHFDEYRLQPTLGLFRPHHGIDFAAASGSDVAAAHAGTVEVHDDPG